MSTPYSSMSPAEKDLKSLSLNSNSQMKLLLEIRDALGGQARPPPSPFGSAGAFLAAVRNAVVSRQGDSRLRNAVSTFGSGTDNPSVGWAVPAQHQGVLAVVTEPSALLARFEPITVTSPLVNVAVDEAPAWAGSFDVRQYVEGEAIVESKPAMKKVNLLTTKLAALVHVSEEAAADGGEVFYSYLARTLGDRLRDGAEYLLLKGTGQNEPLGAFNSQSLVVVAKEGSQTAATIVAANIGKMMARLAPGGLARGFWVAHSSCLPQLMQLGTIYDGVRPGASFGSICGMPIVLSEAANELGAQGDLTLIDPRGYLVAVQGPALRDTVEFAWMQDLHSYRAVMRFTSTPLLSAAVARRAGTDTLSHTVQLAVRS